MIEWWQNLPGSIDPVILTIGSFRLQYYGLMYILAFLITYWLANYRCRTEDGFTYTRDFHKDILTAAFIGVLLGGRLGYVLFYNFEYYLGNPLEVVWPFDLKTGEFKGISGMSFHGGLAGVFISVGLFCRKHKVAYRNIMDLYAPIIPLGYTFGRLGNFINGELYGRVTDSAIGMYFTTDPTGKLRHPSQLYEAALEGLFCFALLWFTRRMGRPPGASAAFYLISYGVVRFIVEYFREPDSHLGLVFFSFSMGQILCLAMIATGLALFFYLKRLAKAS